MHVKEMSKLQGRTIVCWKQNRQWDVAKEDTQSTQLVLNTYCLLAQGVGLLPSPVKWVRGRMSKPTHLITHRAVCAALHPFVNTSQVKMVATCRHNLWILIRVTCQTHSLNQNICLQCLQLNSLNALQGKTHCRTTFAERSWNNFSRCKVPDPDAFALLLL
jgi:hypothetical protein